MSTTFLLLLLIGSTFAATHVNISIAQHPADVTYVDGKASADLKAGPASTKQYSDFDYSRDDYSNNDSNQDRAANLRFADKNSNFEYVNGRGGSSYVNVGSGQKSGFNYNGRSARIQAAGHDVQFDQQQQKQQQQDQIDRRTFGSSTGVRDESQQLREQNKKNQEFERYIQNYHNGPTVETVYESARSSPQRYQQSSSFSSSSSSVSSPSQRIVAIGSRPAQVHTFERQVALPAVTTTNTLLPSSDADRQTHTIVNHQPKSSDEVTQQTSSSSSTSTGTSINQGVPNYDQSTNYDQGVTYKKPDLNGFDVQYPPNVDDSQYSYGGGFYGNSDQSNFYGQTGYGSQSNNGYLPPQPAYQRPLITKTIQIAQPAVRAKKYEVRHPAIQKEFYDIEERVVIKPAGTIVVELDHPVAKISKGESILPLGHPHPAVANAYNKYGGDSVIQTESSSTGSGSSFTTQNNQYSPSPVYNPNQQVPEHPVISSTTIASSIATTPSYDQSSKDDFVEANLNRQFGGDAPQFVTTTERSFSEEKARPDDFYVATDSQGNQHTVSTKNLSPKMIGRDEPDIRYPAQVDIKNNGASVSPSPNTYSNQAQPNTFNYNSRNNVAQASFVPRQSQPEFQSNFNNNNQYKGNNQYNGEQFGAEFYNNKQREELSPAQFYNTKQREDFKPARLQQQPSSFREPSAQIVKHEHNIHLPPVQHNIYLGSSEHGSLRAPLQQQSEQLRSDDYEGEAAHVQEIKPYSQQQKGFYWRQRYTQPDGQQQSSRLRYADDGYNRVQYSAPYSQMRYLPQESARLTYPNYAQKSYNVYYNDASKNKGNLVEQTKSDAVIENADDKLKENPHTHIQIKIPHHTDERNKPIVVSSTISPPQQSADYRQPSSRSFYARDQTGDFERQENFRQDEQKYGNLEYKADCDDSDVVSSNAARYENAPRGSSRGQQKFSRLVETSGATTNDKVDPLITNIPSENVDVNLKSNLGHVATSGSRVIAATPAPTDASAIRESSHKRIIAVNHHFQTVREVVEHEPITNYHQIQVNEPAMLYQDGSLYSQQQSHGALRQAQSVEVPVYYHGTVAPLVTFG